MKLPEREKMLLDELKQLSYFPFNNGHDGVGSLKCLNNNTKCIATFVPKRYANLILKALKNLRKTSK